MVLGTYNPCGMILDSFFILFVRFNTLAECFDQHGTFCIFGPRETCEDQNKQRANNLRGGKKKRQATEEQK